jgi:hypothetical protein
MAVFVFTGASVTMAPTTGGTAVDLSDHVTSVSLNYEKDSIETTAMGATGHVFTGGLQNLSVTLELNNDQAASSVLETLYTNVGTGTTQLIISNTTGAGTQKFTCVSMFLGASTPVNGAVGELSKQSVTLTGGSITKGTV